MSSRDEAVKLAEQAQNRSDVSARADIAKALDAAHDAGLIVWADEAAAYCARCGEPQHRESA